MTPTAYIFLATAYPEPCVSELVDAHPGDWLELMMESESRATSCEGLHPEEEFGDQIVRISPVQLCRHWQPATFLASIGESFGAREQAEGKLGFSDPRMLLDWHPRGASRGDPDIARCALVARRTAIRAVNKNTGVVFLSAPGWDYDLDELPRSQQELFARN